MKEITGGVAAPKGFKAAGIHCGIRKNKTKRDLALLMSERACATAAVYTQNKVKGAPLLVTQSNIADGYSRAMLCNSGNANTCNANGIEIAHACCELLAKETGLKSTDIIIASTGVIGQPLSLEPFETGIPQIVSALSDEGGTDAAQAIMTTDTYHKEFALEFELGGQTCRIGMMTKGSGMINPDMATMLTFMTTDVAITPEMLQRALQSVVKDTLNQISVDGDTSTNDMAIIMANGMAGNPQITESGEDYAVFRKALHYACVWACRQIARDGEGATKLLECTVSHARSPEVARAIAKSVISSDLFKAAMFGADANWGRVLCAIGYTPGDFAVDNIALVLRSEKGEVLVCQESMYYPYSEEEASEVLSEPFICIDVDMGDGEASAQAWGCDLSYDYVRINGDYRS